MEKQATKASASDREAPGPGPAPGDAPAPKKRPAAIDPHRVKHVAQVLGDPVQVVLPNHLDPIEVLGNSDYWVAMPQKHFLVGSKFDLSNDAGTYLFEVWVRGSWGVGSRGLRDIVFFHRVVWDDREEAVVDPVVPTGRWFVRYDGRFYLWRVYRPNGVVVDISFKDQGSADAWLRQQEANPRP